MSSNLNSHPTASFRNGQKRNTNPFSMTGNTISRASCQECIHIKQKPRCGEGNPCLIDGIWQRTNKTRSSISVTVQVKALGWWKGIFIQWMVWCQSSSRVGTEQFWCHDLLVIAPPKTKTRFSLPTPYVHVWPNWLHQTTFSILSMCTWLWCKWLSSNTTVRTDRDL